MRKENTIRVPTEEQEQAMLFTWARTQEWVYPCLDLMYAIPNGGFRHIQTGSRLKATGVRPGVPDICLPVPRSGYHALYIEMKRREGGRVSPSQRKWKIQLEKEWNRVEICHGFEEAKKVILDYLEGDL